MSAGVTGTLTATPLAALIDKAVAQPDPGAQVEQVIRRDVGLRQPPGHQQLPQMPRVSAIALGALPRSALVPAGSAKCASAPTATNSSTTNRQPVAAAGRQSATETV
jgi:hypothetical protein